MGAGVRKRRPFGLGVPSQDSTHGKAGRLGDCKAIHLRKQILVRQYLVCVDN